MTTLELERSVTFKNIAVATDFSEASQHALQFAATIAGANHSQVFLVHVMPAEPRLPIPLDPAPALDRAHDEAQHNLDDFASILALKHVQHETLLEWGAICEVVSDLIGRKNIDLLVVGTHGRTGFKRVALGSVAEELFRCATCPVLTIGPHATPSRPIHRVLLATDFGPSSLHALPYAIDFANGSDGELILLHLAPPLPVTYIGPLWYPDLDYMERGERLKGKLMRQLRELLPLNSGIDCKVQYLVEAHFAPEGILKVAQEREVDLIVMGVRQSGTKAPRLASHMPWAIAHEVVCGAQCGVLTVRA